MKKVLILIVCLLMIFVLDKSQYKNKSAAWIDDGIGLKDNLSIMLLDTTQMLKNDREAFPTNDNLCMPVEEPLNEDGNIQEAEVIEQPEKILESKTENTSSNKTDVEESKQETTDNKNNQENSASDSKDKPSQETLPEESEIPHVHTWIAQTEVVKHEATGHYETVVIEVAWDEPIYEYKTICNLCGEDVSDPDYLDQHYAFYCGGSYSVKRFVIDYIHHEEVTEEVWIEDSPAWDETVVVGWICSCGAEKE